MNRDLLQTTVTTVSATTRADGDSTQQLAAPSVDVLEQPDLANTVRAVNQDLLQTTVTTVSATTRGVDSDSTQQLAAPGVEVRAVNQDLL